MGDNGFDSDSHLVALMQRDVVLFILRTTDANMLKHIKKMIKTPPKNLHLFAKLKDWRCIPMRVIGCAHIFYTSFKYLVSSYFGSIKEL